MSGIGPSLTNVAGTDNISVLNATVPPEGPKAIPTPLDFTTLASAIVDFTLANAQRKITCIQCVYLDNSANTEPVTIVVDGTQQTITAPAGSQGQYVLIATNRSKFTLTTNGAVRLIPIWLNVPLPASIWFPAQGEGQAASGSSAHTVVTGGSAVTVWSPPPAGGAVIKNPDDAGEPLFVDIVNPAQDAEPGTNGTTVELAAGDAFVIGPNFRGTVSVNAASSGHAFVAYGVGA